MTLLAAAAWMGRLVAAAWMLVAHIEAAGMMVMKAWGPLFRNVSKHRLLLKWDDWTGCVQMPFG